jgi:hypothetical protein
MSGRVAFSKKKFLRVHMRPIMVAGATRFIVLLLSWTGSAGATSIVVKLDPDRILIAADVRGVKLGPNFKSSNETECKIVAFNDAAFAVTGIADYVRYQLNDPVRSWDAYSDAREAYRAQSGDLFAAANDWATRATRHYSSFYLANPARVRQLAKANDQNVLLVGMFTGFRGDKAQLIVEKIYLDEYGSQPILHQQLVLPARESPYSSNRITEDLIDGYSARAKSAQTAWLKISGSIPASMRTLRRIEFLIQATAEYDKTVGTRVNVLEVLPHKSPHWLQNFTCQSLT